MPSPRKRIGFLPSTEIHLIINEICKKNKLSQSKVTGILVEEGLISRGIINSNKYKTQQISKSSKIKDNDYLIYGKSSLKNEVEMINEFIEFKLFKKIMNKNKKLFEY